MNVRFGNVDAKEGYKPHDAIEARVELAAKSDEEVLALAAEANVKFDDEATVGIDMIRARIEAQPSFRKAPGNRVLYISNPVGTIGEVFNDITRPNGIWEHHSDSPPAWVESDSDGLAQVLADHYGCPIGKPADWVGLTMGGSSDESTEAEATTEVIE